METSRALSRCLQQLSIHNQSCLRTHTTAAAHRLQSQRNSSRQTSKLLSSSRPFHTSRVHHQEETSSSSKPQDENAQRRSQTQAPPQEQPTQSPVRTQPSRSGISLSNILSDPSYTPPSRQVRTQSSPEAAAKKAADGQFMHSQIDALIANERRESAARRTSNYDSIYGAGGQLFRNTRVPTKPGGPAPSNASIASQMKSIVGLNINELDQQGKELDRDLNRAREQLRLHPSLGKSVEVVNETGFTVTRAFITLEAKINKNGNAVKREEREQKFHVRRGQKRKLKARERWRVVFKEGFLGECARVRKMIRQGW